MRSECAHLPPHGDGIEDLCEINEYVRAAYQNAIDKGFWGDPRRAMLINVGEKIALMHSELSEAFEEWRAGKKLNEVYYAGDENNPARKPEGFPIEMADCVIRIFDFCGAAGIDLQTAIQTKMKYNQQRPHRHGGKRA